MFEQLRVFLLVLEFAFDPRDEGVDFRVHSWAVFDATWAGTVGDDADEHPEDEAVLGDLLHHWTCGKFGFEWGFL
jgi:hypothetical protein